MPASFHSPGHVAVQNKSLKLSALGFLLRRYLLSSFLTKRTRSQAATGVLLPVVGVAIGVAAFTIVLSVMTGFVANLKNKLLGLESHIEVVQKDAFGYVEPNSNLLTTLRNLKGSPTPLIGISPFHKGDVIFQGKGRATTAILWGVDPVGAEQSSNLSRYLAIEKSLKVLSKDADSIEGGAFAPVIIGRELANMMNLNIGDRATLVSTTPEDGPGGMAPKQFPVVVADLLATGSPTHDAKLIVGSLTTTDAFYDLEGSWSGLQVKLQEPLLAEETAQFLNTELAKFDLAAKPWTEANKTLLKALRLERWGMTFVLYMVILVGCFSITITLVLAVKRKSREMAILRSFGFERKDLGLLFLLHGLLIGCIGVALGLGVSFGLLWALKSSKFEFLNAAYAAKNVAVVIDWQAVSIVSFGSLLLAMLAAVWPAFEVMKIDVVESLADRG